MISHRRESFASRLSRALAPEDYVAAFAEPEQPSLFAPKLSEAWPILTILGDLWSIHGGEDVTG